MSAGETAITLVVLILFIYIIYTTAKKQSLRDTWDEITELFRKKGET
jgi:hypothetical protein